MSLDLDGKINQIVSTTDLAWGTDTFFVPGTFTETLNPAEAKKIIVKVDTSAGDFPITPAVVAGISEGDEVTFVKVTAADTNKITFTDPNTGIALSYADKQGESMTLVYTGTGTVWHFKF